MRPLQGYLGMSSKWHTLTEAQQQGAKYLIIGAPLVMTAMFWSFPAALCYYWTCSNLYSIVFELVFRHPSRAHPPRPSPPAPPPEAHGKRPALLGHATAPPCIPP